MWNNKWNNILAPIDQKGGLYGRILTRSRLQIECREVCTHDQGQGSLIQTDLARLIRYLLYGKNKNNLIRLM